MDQSKPAQLDYSRPLRWDRVANDDAAKALIGDLVLRLEAAETRIRRRKAFDQRRLVATAEAMILDLVAMAVVDPDKWLSYSRRREDYSGKSRYRNPAISYQPACEVADFLTGSGFAQGAKGFVDRGHYGGLVTVARQSRIRATDALVALASAHGLTHASIGIAETSETIRLKAAGDRGRTKPLKEYADTAATIAMRKTMATINVLLAITSIRLPRDESVDEQHDREEAEEGSADRSAVRLYRVFNNGRFDRGGRLYGGWWQALPKADRTTLRINGEAVVELDYSGLHPRLCYALSGQPLDVAADPYAIAGLPAGVDRELVKRAFAQLLNGTDKTKRAPAGCAERLPKGISWARLLRIVEAHHVPASNWLRCQRGLELQAIDSDIAATVVHFLALRGIPCLPVHDSFIVPRRHERTLGETMILAYQGQVGRHTTAPGMPAIKGWSSPSIGMEIMEKFTC